MSASPLPSLYNPRSQRDDDKFIAEFVARHDLLETLLRRLRTADSDSLGLHHILIGPRGMGKTSLLRRIAIAIGREPDLSARLIPLNFREEQYNVLTLGDFWRNCGESLAEWAEATGQADLARRLDQALPTEAWATDEAAAEQFKAEMKALGRRPVLLVDNLDLILDALPDESNWALRRRLQARRGPILIGASTHPLKQSADRDAAFYEFFQPDYLQPLDAQETERCMRALAASGGEHGARVVRILDAQPARLRTLHTLTAGNPRILALIYRLLGAGESDAAMADLERLLDQVTPYYKAKVEEYQTAQQRAVIDAIALNWDPVTTGDLADLTRIPSTTLSPLLIRLRKDGLIESVELSGAYAGHQLAERFLNIWYLMRHGTRRTKQKMRWLVAFLTSFYSLSDLTEIAGGAPDQANWCPEYKLAFDEALERQALRVKAGQVLGIEMEPHESSRLQRGTPFYSVIDDGLSDFQERGEQTNRSLIDHAKNQEFSDLGARIHAANVLVKEALILAREGDGAAIAICDEVLTRFSHVAEPGLRERVARALVIKAVTLVLTGENAAAIVVCDDVLARFADAPEPIFRKNVAWALLLKALYLGQTGDNAAAIAICDEVFAYFADASEPGLRKTVAKALVIKAINLGQMGNGAAATIVCDEVASYAAAPESGMAEEVAGALALKAIILSQMGDSAAELAIYDEIIVRFAESTEPSLREQAVEALFNKAVTLRQMGDRAAALATYDEVLARFADATEPSVQELVAKALVNSAITSGELGDLATAITVCNAAVARFVYAPEPNLREQVAIALHFKSIALLDLGQINAAIDTFEQLFEFTSSRSPTFKMFEYETARVNFANVLLDFRGDLKRPESIYREVEITEPLFAKVNLAWLYLLADRSSDARRELDELGNLPPVGLALLRAGMDIAIDNFGSATSNLAMALASDLDEGGMSFGVDLERLLRLAHGKGYGEHLLAWFEQTGFADRLAPVYVAFKAYVRTDKVLLDVNPEVRGPAQIIYDRLDAPRRYAAANAPQTPKPRRLRRAAPRGR